MSSAFSTITSNVNLLLVNSSTITNFNPYVAYISSVSIPGRIATVRDAVGLVSSPGRLIILSTLKDVRFSDGTSSITISQPFGYISLSSRDKNTWDIINTFAFPMPSPVSYVSSVFATDGIIANSYLSRTYVSTASLNTDSISSYRIKASTISTANLFSQNISSQNLFSFNNIFTNVSTQTASTNFIFASNVSTNTVTSQNVLVSSLTLSNISGKASLTLSNDGQAILVNGIPTGTFKAISTATTTLNMANNSISNVLNMNVANISTINISTANIIGLNANIRSLSSFNLQTQNISSGSTVMNSLAVNSLFSNAINNIQVNTDFNMNNNNINNVNNVITTSVTVDNIYANTLPAIGLNNDINMNYNNIQRINDLSANNILALNSIKCLQKISAVDISCNNISNLNIYTSNIYTSNIYTSNIYLTPNYNNITSGIDIIGGARQNFTNLLDISGGFNTLLSHTNSNENNCIKVTNTNQQKIWNIDTNINLRANQKATLQAYFTLFNLTQNKQYYFDSYNPSNYLIIDASGSIFNNNNIKLTFSDTFYGDFNNNDIIYLNTYLNASNSVIHLNNNDLSGAWNIPTTGLLSDNYLCAAYGNHTWIVGSSNNGVFKSTDNATTFSQITIPTLNTVRGITYGNGIWIAVGNGTTNTWYSTDNGNNWSIINSGDFDILANSVTYGKGVFVAVGYATTRSNIKYSTDGSNWNDMLSGNNFNLAGTCVRFFNNRFVAVGNDNGGINTIQYSDDGMNWTSIASNTFISSRIARSLGYGSGRWYVVGDSNIFSSSNNGVSWVQSFSLATTGQAWDGIYVGEGIILTSYAGSSCNANFFYSVNGLANILPINGNTTPQPFYGIEYGNHTYIAFGSNTVYKKNAVNFVNYSLQPAAIQPPV